MAQTTSYEIANDSGAVVRGRLNEVFAAVQSSNSGPSAPTNTAPGMLWLDTGFSPAVLRVRNSANSAWLEIPVNPFSTKALAEPFAIWDHISGITAPNNDGEAKYIRLTAGESGAGGYNEGLLTDEQVSGSAPLVEADAEIAVGPLQGERVPLLNTEGAFVRPGTSSGTLQFDQMQRITGVVSQGNGQRFTSSSGAFSLSSATSLGATSDVNSGSLTATFNSAGSPNARASSDTNGETRPKNRQATYYMRIV